jgi:hypothetical protein
MTQFWPLGDENDDFAGKSVESSSNTTDACYRQVIFKGAVWLEKGSLASGDQLYAPWIEWLGTTLVVAPFVHALQ